MNSLVRCDASLLRAYEAQKHAILAGGMTQSSEYSKAKGEFIRRALGGNVDSKAYWTNSFLICATTSCG